MRARFSSAALSDTFEREPIDTYIFLPSGEKTMHRVQCPPPRNKPPGERCAASCWAGPRAFRSPLRYGNRTRPSVFATLQKLRVVTGWIKGDPERFVEIAFCKSFSHIRFAITVGIAQ